ncbi:MAG: fumarylacetoacetate hydrolase family protein [Planctomycetota bacterium]
MKIVRFVSRAGASYGVLENDVIDVLEGVPFGGLRRAGRKVALAQAKLLAPVEPPNVLAIGLNYRPHADESKMKIPERPLLFLKATTAVIGPGEAIELPREAPGEVDYEAELCVVLGRRARNVREEEALEYALGYTCGNDVSARDCQLRLDGQWARGKSFDTFCPLGPWIETQMNPENADVRLVLNGEVMQESNTSQMLWSCGRLISYLSRCMTLPPGTVIMTGTPSGVGFARKPPVFLSPGDRVRVEVEGIGVLENPVVAESQAD